MNYQFSYIDLTEDQRLWLEKVYDKFKLGEKSDYRRLKVELWNQIPNNFNPNKIDNRLLIGGYELTLLGIWHVDPASSYFKLCDDVVKLIREWLLENPEIKKVTALAVAEELGVTELDVSWVFMFLKQMGRFWSGGSGRGYGGYYEVNIDDDSFNSYLEYIGIEALVEKFYNKSSSIKYEIPTVFDPTTISSFETNRKELFSNMIDPIFKTKLDKFDPKLCFILMPFKEEWSQRVYKEYIRQNVEKMGLQCLRADELNGQIIIEDIWVKINQCAFIIADVTNRNPNVMYELGIVHTIGKPAILITQDIKNIPFDFSHLRHYEYKDNTDGYKEFSVKLPIVIKEIYKESYGEELNFKE